MPPPHTHKAVTIYENWQPWILAWASMTLCKSHREEGSSLQALACVLWHGAGCGVQGALSFLHPGSLRTLTSFKAFNNFPPLSSRKKMRSPGPAALNITSMSLIVWKAKTDIYLPLGQPETWKPYSNAYNHPNWPCHPPACLVNPSSYKIQSRSEWQTNICLIPSCSDLSSGCRCSEESRRAIQ